jgi:hypothetical protein
MNKFKEIIKLMKETDDKEFEKQFKSNKKSFDKKFGVKNGKFTVKLEKDAPVQIEKK